MIKKLRREIRALKRQIARQKPAHGVGIATDVTSRGTIRRPANNNLSGSGSGTARWA